MALKKKKKVKKAAKKRSIKRSRKSTKKLFKKLTKKVLKKKIRKAVRKTVKKSAKKPSIKKAPKVEGNLIGLITHYFPHVQAAVIKLKGPLAMGDTVKIKGFTTDLTQVVSSMQIDRVDIQTAKKGDEIGLQVSSRVRQQDKVYKI